MDVVNTLFTLGIFVVQVPVVLIHFFLEFHSLSHRSILGRLLSNSLQLH